MLSPQGLIIVAAVIGTVGSLGLRAVTSVRRPRLLVAAASVFTVVALYESYVHFAWEPTVHGPIRIDLAVIDMALMLLAVLLVAGALAGGMRIGRGH